MKELLKELHTYKLGKIVEHVPLKEHTTYRVGGTADAFIYPKTATDLVKIMKLIKTYQVPYFVLGKGSNVLFSDRPFHGLIIKLDELDEVKIRGQILTVGAGFSLMKLSSLVARKGLSGLEFASGIPGSVGGAIYMNAGAYKKDMGYIVTKVKVLTPSGRIISMVNRELNFHYRSSFFQQHKDYIVLEATLKLQQGVKEEILALMQERKERRLETQPLEYPSAGSVFRNPENQYAGKLIEDIGLKGLTRGGAMISPKHANFIVNIGNATSQDIKDLMDLVKVTVKDNYHIDLKVEQELVNWE